MASTCVKMLLRCFLPQQTMQPTTFPEQSPGPLLPLFMLQQLSRNRLSVCQQMHSVVGDVLRLDRMCSETSQS